MNFWVSSTVLEYNQHNYTLGELKNKKQLLETLKGNNSRQKLMDKQITLIKFKHNSHAELLHQHNNPAYFLMLHRWVAGTNIISD